MGVEGNRESRREKFRETRLKRNSRSEKESQNGSERVRKKERDTENKRVNGEKEYESEDDVRKSDLKRSVGNICIKRFTNELTDINM